LSLFLYRYAYDYTIEHSLGKKPFEDENKVFHTFTITDGSVGSPYISLKAVSDSAKKAATGQVYQGINKDTFIEHYNEGVALLGTSEKNKFGKVEKPTVLGREDESKTISFSRGEGVMLGETFPYSDIMKIGYYLCNLDDDGQAIEAIIFVSSFMEGDDSSERLSAATNLIQTASSSFSGNISDTKKAGKYDFLIMAVEGQMVFSFQHQESKDTDNFIPGLDIGQTDPSDADAEATVLSMGEYSVGKHINPGEYKVVPIKSGIITVFRDGNVKTSEYLDVDDEDEIGRLVLERGDTVEISGGKLEFVPIE
jgi:hypothetical protein